MRLNLYSQRYTNTHTHATLHGKFCSVFHQDLFLHFFAYIFSGSHAFLYFVLVACLGVRFTVFFQPHSNLITFVFIYIHTYVCKKNICGSRTHSFSVVIYTKCNFAHPILCVTGSVGIFIIIKAYTASALHTWKRNVLLIQNAIFPISRFYSCSHQCECAHVSASVPLL